VTARAPVRAASCATSAASEEGSASSRGTAASRILAVSAASEAGDGGTPGAGSAAATMTRPKRRAKYGQLSWTTTARMPYRAKANWNALDWLVATFNPLAACVKTGSL